LVIVSPPRVFWSWSGLPASGSSYSPRLPRAFNPSGLSAKLSLAQAVFVPGHGCGAAGDFHPSSTTPAQSSTNITIYLFRNQKFKLVKFCTNRF